MAKKNFLAKNGEKYAILIDFGNFCYGKIITKKWKLEVKVIISRQFYFEISGIRLEGGNSKLLHLNIIKLRFLPSAKSVLKETVEGLGKSIQLIGSRW